MHPCKCIPSQKQFLKLIFFPAELSGNISVHGVFICTGHLCQHFKTAWLSELNVPNDQHKMLQDHGLVFFLLLLLRLTTTTTKKKTLKKQFWREGLIYVQSGYSPSLQGRQGGHLKLCSRLFYSQKQRERNVCPLSLEPKLRPCFHHQWKGLGTSIHVIRTVLQRHPHWASWSRQPLTEIFFLGGSILCQIDT